MGFKNLILEKKLEAMAQDLEKTESALAEILASTNLQPDIIGDIKHNLEDVLMSKNKQVICPSLLPFYYYHHNHNRMNRSSSRFDNYFVLVLFACSFVYDFGYHDETHLTHKHLHKHIPKHNLRFKSLQDTLATSHKTHTHTHTKTQPQIQKLEDTLADLKQSYARAIQLYEGKLVEHNIPPEEVGFTPVRRF